MNPIVLICTVGSSHEPIVTAIRQSSPSYVCFLCTGKDPATGRLGSDSRILGTGNFIKKDPTDAKPTLPNIPAQAGLREDQYEVIEVSADDLDQAFTQIRKALARLSEQFPTGQFLADYTGGTKTMTAALVTAVLESDAIALQLVTGARADLVKVRSGMESAMPVNVERIRLERAIAAYIAAWQRFAYAEAAQGLASLKPPRDSSLATKLCTLRDLSRAFDAWDRFDHAKAFDLLHAYWPKLQPVMPLHLDTVIALAIKPGTSMDEPETPKDELKQELIRLFDLWLNAQRRAVQGRYDDAVARLYRLTEWAAQWILRKHCGIDTSDIPADRIPSTVNLTANQKGKFQAGLFSAWKLVEHMLPDSSPAKQFIRGNWGPLQGHIENRNRSIFGHGFKPVSEDEYRPFSTWIEQQLIPMLVAEATKLKLRTMPPQLPTSPDWIT